MKLDEQYILYALGELEPEEEKEIELQLQQNPELMVEVEKIRQTDGLLADVFAQSDESWESDENIQSENEAVSCDRTNLATRNSQLATRKKTAWRVLFTLATLILIAIGGVVMFFPFLGVNHQMIACSPREDMATEERSIVMADSADYAASPAEEVVAEEETVTFNAVELPHSESHALGLVKQINSPSLQKEEVYSVPALADAESVALQAEVADKSAIENEVLLSQVEEKTNLELEESQSDESEYDPMMALLLDSEMCKGCLDQLQRLKIDNPLKDNAVYKNFAQQYSETKKQVLYGLFCSCMQKGDCTPIVLNYFGLTVPDMTNRMVDDLSKDERFALAVVRFIDLVRTPKLRTRENFQEILTLLSDSVEKDGKRLEFKTLVEKAMSLKSEN